MTVRNEYWIHVLHPARRGKDEGGSPLFEFESPFSGRSARSHRPPAKSPRRTLQRRAGPVVSRDRKRRCHKDRTEDSVQSFIEVSTNARTLFCQPPVTRHRFIQLQNFLGRPDLKGGGGATVVFDLSPTFQSPQVAPTRAEHVYAVRRTMLKKDFLGKAVDASGGKLTASLNGTKPSRGNLNPSSSRNLANR
jgi:hypothetical protein